MFTANLFIFLALAVALVILAFILFYLAAQHDKALAIAGPLEDERTILSRIAAQKQDFAEIEEKIATQQQALAHLSDLGAEVDALERKRDELLVEWNQSEARRREVDALRHETETARIEQLEVNAILAEARANLEEVKDRLAKAENIDQRIAALTQERESLEAEVSARQATLETLEAAEARLSTLAEEVKRLEAEATTTAGKIAAKNSELIEIEDRLSSTRLSYSAQKDEADRLTAEIAAARQRSTDLAFETKQRDAELSSLSAQIAAKTSELDAIEEKLVAGRSNHSAQKDEADRLSAEIAAARQRSKDITEEHSQALDRIGSLEARKASIEREIEKIRGQAAGDSGDAEVDPLRELKQLPQVIRGLSTWSIAPPMNEADALKGVKERFKAFGLSYPDQTLYAFHTAMKVNDTTQMAVLAGISGTGKSQLPRQYAAGMGIGFLQVPVQPRWDSPQDLMGFYNYIEGRFRPTDMARALFALDEQNNDEALKDRMLMILLDEMNLARVEYYFSDFLSRLESRPEKGRESDPNLRKDAEIELEIPKSPQRIFPGYNLLFAGTMNEDESTQSLSDKVVDRANVMRFGAPRALVQSSATHLPAAERALRRSQWDRWCQHKLSASEESRAKTRIDEMLEIMQDFGKPFAHRLGRAILAFTAAYPDVEGISDRVSVALAAQIEMRLLPKLRGVDIEENGQNFDRLKKLADDLGDPALSEAITHSVDAAEATGQFVWKGVIR